MKTLNNFLPDYGQELLLTALLARRVEAAPAAEKWLGLIDFDLIGAAETRLMPMFSSRMSEFAIDHPYAGRIRGLYRRAWYLDKMMRRELSALRAVISSAAESVVLLKGAALGPLVYADSAHRPFDDFDILVREEDQQRVITALLINGACSERYALHARTVRLPCGIDVDIHRSPYHHAFSKQHVTPLFSRLRPIGVAGQGPSWMTLGDTDQLLHTFVHGLRPSFIAPIRWIIDAVLLVRRFRTTIDWEFLVRETCRLEMVEPVLTGLKVVARYEHAPEIQRAIGALDAFATVQSLKVWHENTLHPNKITKLWDQSRLNARGIGRLRLIFEFLRRDTTWRSRGLRDVVERTPRILATFGVALFRRALLKVGGLFSAHRG
jgi:Uncharacterised nucleotidyltransferase